MALTSPWRCSQGLHAPTLSDTERRALFRDGFIVLRRVVDAEAAAAARDIVLHPELRGDQRELFYHDAIVKLYTEGRLSAILDDVMGPHTRPIASQVALTPNGQGYPGEDPAHVDGGWAGEHPQSVGDILASGQTLETWGTQDSPKSLGPAGFAPLWQDPEMKSAIGSFTAFAGVCLSDQTKPDSGQFSVHRGAHDGVEAFFRRQRDAGGPLGGGGPFWPRLIQHSVPPGHPLSDKAFAGVMPEAMRAGYPDEGKLTPVMMEPGDGVITLHAIPHAATMNRNEEPRINVYWRAPHARPAPLSPLSCQARQLLPRLLRASGIRRLREQNPHEGNPAIQWGISDHPDRAMDGGFLDYSAAPDYDPFAYSREKLCDHWSEWRGVQDLVAERAGEGGAARL